MKIIQQCGVTERRSNFVITLFGDPLLEGDSYYLIIIRHSFFHFKGNSHFKVMFKMRWKYAYIKKKIYA